MSDREVTVRVSAYFVPVAVNLSEIRNAKGAGGDLFRSVQRQKDQYQGLWLIAPDGRVLAAHHAPRSPETWTAEVRQTIRSALAAITLPTPRTDVRRGLLKDRGRAVHSDGSVRLALSVRLIFQGKPEGEGAFDGIRLSAPDWSEFLPPDSTPGRSWTIPERVVRAFSRCLSPASDQSTMPRPEEVTDVSLTGKVIEVFAGRARILYTGRIAAAHAHDGKSSSSHARFTGLGTYDVSSRSLVSLTLLAEGIHGAPPPYPEDRPIAAAIEWRAGAGNGK